MGFMEFLSSKAKGLHARQTPSSSPTIQNHPWIGIAFGGPGRIRNGGSTYTGFFMVPCTPPIKVDVQGLSGIQCVSTFQVRQTQKDAIEGTLNFFLTEFVNPGEYTTTINVTDSAGRTGSENYHLTVLEAAVPTLQPQPPLGTLTLISEGRRNKKRHSEPDPHGQKSE